MVRLVGFLVLIAAFAVAGGVSAAALRAGVATADITPPLGCNMWGYSDRQGGAQKVHDPLIAKALALATDRGSLAIITLDLGRPFDPDLRDMIEKHAAEVGIDAVMLVASHTHQGPDMEARDWPKPDAPWQVEAAGKVADAVVRAAKSMQPAVIGFGTGEADLGHNRRKVMPDGSVRMFWRNEKHEPTSPVDKTVRLLRIDSTGGDHIALLVNYACHPVVLGPDNLMLSADYVGVMRKAVEEKWGGQCMFLQGACGDINPYMDKTPLDKGGVDEMGKMGRALAVEVLRAAATIQASPLSQSAAVMSRRTFDFEPRWTINDAAMAELRKKYEPYIKLYGEERVKMYVERLTKGASVRAATAVLGGQYAFCGFPGEVFVSHQLDLARRSPLPATMFLGYADDYAGYFPTIETAAQGGYGADYSTSVEVGAGERLVDYHVIAIHTAIGRLKPVPGAPVADYPEEQ
jgi:neutral ceramidase